MKLSNEYRDLYNASINQLSDEEKKSYDESIVKNALIDFITSAEHDLRERESQAWWEAREREDYTIKKFRERSNIESLNRHMDKLLNDEYGNITNITTALTNVIKSIAKFRLARKMQGGYKRKRTIKKKRKRSKQSKKVKSKRRKRTKRKSKRKRR